MKYIKVEILYFCMVVYMTYLIDDGWGVPDAFDRYTRMLKDAFKYEHPELEANLTVKTTVVHNVSSSLVGICNVPISPTGPLADFIKPMSDMIMDMNAASMDARQNGFSAYGQYYGPQPIGQDPSFWEAHDSDYLPHPLIGISDNINTRLLNSYINALNSRIDRHIVELGPRYQGMQVQGGIFVNYPGATGTAPRYWYFVSVNFAQAARAEGYGDEIFYHEHGLAWRSGTRFSQLHEDKTVQQIFDRMGLKCPLLLPMHIS